MAESMTVVFDPKGFRRQATDALRWADSIHAEGPGARAEIEGTRTMVGSVIPKALVDLGVATLLDAVAIGWILGGVSARQADEEADMLLSLMLSVLSVRGAGSS